MKYCGYCGKKMPEEMLYCPSCGKRQEITDATQDPPMENVTDVTVKKRRNTRKVWVVAVAIFVALSAIAAIVLFCPKSFSEDTKKINKAAQSVVMLSCYDDSDNLLATGSGFIAISDDIVITNFHVIDYSLKIRVSTEQDKSYEVDKVLAYDEKSDVAILKLSEKTGLSVLPLGNSDRINKGDKIIAIGSPLGIKNTVSTGVLSGRFWDSVSSLDILQFTAPISSGSSGGALFNESGSVIGVTYASIIDGQNLNLAIPIEQVDVIYNTKGTAITLSELCEKNHPGYNHYLDSQIVQYSDLVKNPKKYNGKSISVVGYVAEAEDGWGKPPSEIYLLPAKEYITWEDEPTAEILPGVFTDGYIWYWTVSTFENSYMIRCKDETQSKLTKYIDAYVIVTGIFAYDDKNTDGSYDKIASMELLYVDEYTG